MTFLEQWRFLLGIYEARHEPPTVRNSQLQRRSSSPLIMARAVIAIPR